jgi:hypothetical protein
MLKDIFQFFHLSLFFKLIIKNKPPALIKTTLTGLGCKLIKEVPMAIKDIPIRNNPR